MGKVIALFAVTEDTPKAPMEELGAEAPAEANEPQGEQAWMPEASEGFRFDAEDQRRPYARSLASMNCAS